MRTVEVHGFCDLGLAPVREAFAENFARHSEIGAAFAVVREGRLVADMWAGARLPDADAAWTRETIANVWSTTKGVAAIAFAMLVDRGQCAYEDAVAKHWPEFAANGKAGITIAQLLSHQAGLAGFDTPAKLDDYLDQDRAAARLAAQAPLWPPGGRSGYHALTFGNLVNALFARIEGRSLRAFVEQELAAAFDLELAIGLPAGWSWRAADLAAPPEMASTDAGPGFTPIQRAALANPAFDPTVANRAPWRNASLPSANGFANARALARLYGALVHHGRLDGRRLVSHTAVEEARAVRVEGEDLVLGLHARWAAGFLRNVHGLYGPSSEAFGHSGWGGSFAFADPEHGIAAAYVMNRMGPTLVGEPRAAQLVSALYRSLGR